MSNRKDSRIGRAKTMLQYKIENYHHEERFNLGYFQAEDVKQLFVGVSVSIEDLDAALQQSVKDGYLDRYFLINCDARSRVGGVDGCDTLNFIKESRDGAHNELYELMNNGSICSFCGHDIKLALDLANLTVWYALAEKYQNAEYFGMDEFEEMKSKSRLWSWLPWAK